MKSLFSVFAVSLLAASSTQAVFPDALELDRGPHHRTWGRVQQIQTPQGVLLRTNTTVVELQGGLHRWDAAQQTYVLSNPRIEPFQDGAVVRGLQYSVIFAQNLATPGALDILLPLPDGQRLTGHLLCLAYTEGAKSVLIAEVQDCAGQIAGPEQNELTYVNVFTDYTIDVLYRVERDRLCQDILVHERLRPPTDYGLTDDAHLELLTEWTTAPAPALQTRIVEPAHGAQHALTDQRISLGAMEFLSGKAFLLGDPTPAEELVPSKSWETINDQGAVRTFLIEKIPWRQIQPHLQRLPPPQAQAAPGRDARPRASQLARSVEAGRASGASLPLKGTLSLSQGKRDGVRGRAFANLPTRQAKRPTLKPIQMAQARDSSIRHSSFVIRPSDSPSLVIDFELGLTTNSMRWRSDTTYYISGPITVTTNIFEPTCIKYAPTNNAKLTINGPVTCLSTNYRPVILTARDDHGVGEQIGSANLSGYYATTALYLDYNASGVIYDLSHFHVRHAQNGIEFAGGNDHLLRHCQFVNCSNAAVKCTYASTRLRNVLAHSAYYMLAGNGNVHGENVTFRSASAFYSGGISPYLTNCLLAGITSVGGYSGVNNAQENSADGPFTSVGAGKNYLVAGSTNRNAGTTNLNASLLSDLRKLTTYPPLVLSNQYLTVDTLLSPQAQRDTDLPDRGYHYAPIDYAVHGLYVTNGVTLTVAPGTALAAIGGNLNNMLTVHEGSKLVCEGTALQRNQIAPYTLVQEQLSAWGSVPGYVFSTPWWTASPAPQVRFRFTDWSLPASSLTYHVYGWAGTSPNLVFRDCQFLGGMFFTEQPGVSLTNCLMERVDVQLWDTSGPFDVSLRNNLFYGGYLTLYHADTGLWTVKDNLFDKTLIPDVGSSITNGYNAYTFTNHGRILPVTGGDVVLGSSNIVYETSWLGRWYVPTNLAVINVGSTNAHLLSLWHFTCTTNQVKETNSVVDIGAHYAAVDANGNLLDSDSDGVPDVLEDANGNGAINSGETDPGNPTDLGLRVFITRPSNGSQIP